MLAFSCTKNTSVFAYMYIHSAHGVLCAYCVFIQYGSELRMGIIKTFEHQQQSADDCLRIFVHQNKQLQWVSDMYTLTFPQVYVTHTLLPSLLSCMFPCCKSQRNTSSRSCHSALWVALRSQIHGQGPRMHVYSGTHAC